MSAAPAPKPDEAPEPAADADGWVLLEGLRRRIDDQGALGRKTAAQVTQLADSIAGLVSQQRRRSLWLNVNSFVAYLTFTVLCAAGCYLLYQSRARELAAARDQAVAERDAAVRRADAATVRAVARESADTKAWEIYQLLEAGKRGEAVGKLDALRDAPLSKTERAVLAARVHDTQVMEVDTALKTAIAAFKAGRPGDMIKPLEAALTGEPPGPRAATIHYYLGVAYARTELDKAATHLSAAIAGDVDQEDARFQLASVLDRSGAYGPARAEYDRFATAHPQSQLAVFAMRRSATLSRLPASVPPAAGAVVAPGSAPGVAPNGVPRPAGAIVPTGVAPGVAPNGVPRPAGAVVPDGVAPNGVPRPAAGAIVPNGAAPGMAPSGPARPGAVVPNGAAPGLRAAGAAPGVVPGVNAKPGLAPKPALPPALVAKPAGEGEAAAKPGEPAGAPGAPGQ